MSADAKLNDLNNTLGSIENELLRRKVAAREAHLDAAVELIGKLADDGHVEVVPCCSDDGEDE